MQCLEIISTSIWRASAIPRRANLEPEYAVNPKSPSCPAWLDRKTIRPDWDSIIELTAAFVVLIALKKFISICFCERKWNMLRRCKGRDAKEGVQKKGCKGRGAKEGVQRKGCKGRGAQFRVLLFTYSIVGITLMHSTLIVSRKFKPRYNFAESVPGTNQF